MAAAAAVLALGVTLSPARAATVNYYNITNENVEASALGSQLSTEITEGANNTVLFKFLNDVGIKSSIADIYFADNLGLFAPPPSIVEQHAGVGDDGVSFGPGTSPASLPSQGDATPAFLSTTSLSMDSNNPPPKNGINSSTEWLVLALKLAGTNTFASVIAALDSGALRLGLHVQAIGVAGKSDSFVSLPPSPVPLPAGVWLFGTAIVGTAALGARRRRRGSTAA